MSGLSVRVWRRYGQVRLYVSAGDGEIGWYDPRTGRFLLTEPEMAAEFWAAALAESDATGGQRRPAGTCCTPCPSVIAARTSITW